MAEDIYSDTFGVVVLAGTSIDSGAMDELVSIEVREDIVGTVEPCVEY